MSPNATTAHLLNTSKDHDSTISLGSLLQCLTVFCEEIFPSFQYKPAQLHLEAISPFLSLVTAVWELTGEIWNCNNLEEMDMDI